jgi:putative colanic acid biosynthesis glycosyltransferase
VKAAFVNSVAGYGSTGRLVDELARMKGLESRIYFGRKENSARADTFRLADPWTIFMQAAATFTANRQGWTNAKGTKKAVEDLEKFQPDLVHLHNLHGYYLDCPTLFAWLKQSGVPVIWTLHDCWSFTGHCAHYDQIQCRQWQKDCGNCPALNQYPWTWSKTGVKRAYADKKALFTSLGSQLTIVTPSHWLADQVHQSFLKDFDCRIIPNGIDLHVFHPVESSWRRENGLEGKRIILAVASIWTAAKGYEDLKKAAALLQEDEKLAVIGVSAKQKKELESCGILAIERTSDVNTLVQMYTASDVFWNPTYEDTFPTVNLEALACGCPVVTYQTGGSPEAVDVQTGTAVSQGDVRGALKAMRRLQVDRDACRKRAQCFSQETMLEAYRKLYEEKTGGRL